MVRVIFKLRVSEGIGRCSADFWFSKHIDMPFVPHVGMEVIDGDWSGTVESLTYKDGVLFAFVAADTSKKIRTLHELEEIAKEYKSQGWTRSSGILSL